MRRLIANYLQKFNTFDLDELVVMLDPCSDVNTRSVFHNPASLIPSNSVWSRFIIDEDDMVRRRGEFGTAIKRLERVTANMVDRRR